MPQGQSLGGAPGRRGDLADTARARQRPVWARPRRARTPFPGLCPPPLRGVFQQVRGWRRPRPAAGQRHQVQGGDTRVAEGAPRSRPWGREGPGTRPTSGRDAVFQEQSRKHGSSRWGSRRGRGAGEPESEGPPTTGPAAGVLPADRALRSQATDPGARVPPLARGHRGGHCPGTDVGSEEAHGAAGGGDERVVRVGPRAGSLHPRVSPNAEQLLPESPDAL